MSELSGTVADDPFDGRHPTSHERASVTEDDGNLYVLCFSDLGPVTGPYPVIREELRAAFNSGTGWNVAAIEPNRIHTTQHDDGVPAWLATIKRTL